MKTLSHIQRKEIEWLRQRYDYLLEKSFGNEHRKLYEATKAELIKTDALRTQIYLNKIQ